MKCPRCGDLCLQPTVDIGIGDVPIGPWSCDSCHWVEGIPAEEQAELDKETL